MTPRKRTGKAKTEDTHAFLSIVVEEWSASIGVSINRALYSWPPTFYDENEPAHVTNGTIEITGRMLEPLDRAGDAFEMTVYARHDNDWMISMKVRDYQEKDEGLAPRYRRYRGQDYPVYDAPLGLATIERRRGQRLWQTVQFVDRQTKSEMIQLLSTTSPLYVSLHEVRVRRVRWVRSLTLQTSDPRDE